VIDDRLVFGDKAGWIYMLSVADASVISELKIGDKRQFTPQFLESHLHRRLQWKSLLPWDKGANWRSQRVLPGDYCFLIYLIDNTLDGQG